MEFERILKYLKRSNTFDKKSYIFYKLPYWTVKVDVGNALEKGDLLGAVSSVVGREVEETSEALCFGLWIFDKYKDILAMEQKTLSDIPDKDLLNAGIDRLNIFGELTVIDFLADGNILEYERIKQMPYEDVYNKLFLNKVKADINKEYLDQLKK